MTEIDHRVERLRELIDEIHDEEFDKRANDALAQSDSEEYAALIYEYNGTPGLLNHLFRELSELESCIDSIENAEGVAEYGIDPEQHRQSSLRQIREDYLPSIRAFLLSLAEQEVPKLRDAPSKEANQALLSPKERRILRGEEDGKKHVEARVRRRIRERFSEDIEILKDESPDIYDDLQEAVLEESQRDWTPEEFSPGDTVRLEGGGTGIVESVKMSSSGVITLWLQSGSMVPADQVVKIL